MVRAVTPAERRVRRRLVGLLALLVLTGSWGVSAGAASLGSTPRGASFEAPASDPQVAALEEELAALRMPLQRPLGAANIVVSILLLAAAWAVATARPTRVWWVTQAALANAVWTGLEAGSQVFGLLGAKGRLLPAFRDAMQTGPPPPPDAPAWMTDGRMLLYMGVGLIVTFAFVRLGVYALMIWLARRLE